MYNWHFPHNLRVFCLHGRVLLVIGLIFAYGLATTLSIAVYCNTAITSESVYCMLIACGIKYVRLLATTFDIVICCNTAIRSESIRHTLITYGRVFVCCSAATLGIFVRCDTTIRPNSVCCAGSCQTFIHLPRSLEIKVCLDPWIEVPWVPAGISLFPINCLFVIFRWEGFIAPISGSSPRYRVHAAFGLFPICCTFTVIGISVRHGPATPSLIPVRCKMGIHLS